MPASVPSVAVTSISRDFRSAVTPVVQSVTVAVMATPVCRRCTRKVFTVPGTRAVPADSGASKACPAAVVITSFTPASAAVGSTMAVPLRRPGRVWLAAVPEAEAVASYVIGRLMSALLASSLMSFSPVRLHRAVVAVPCSTTVAPFRSTSAAKASRSTVITSFTSLWLKASDTSGLVALWDGLLSATIRSIWLSAVCEAVLTGIIRSAPNSR